MKKYIIWTIILSILLISTVSSLLYKPRCFIKDSLLSTEKTYLEIGEKHESYGNLYICELRSLFKAELNQTGMIPEITIRLKNSTATDIESILPKLDGYIEIEGTFIRVMEDGTYTSTNGDLPYCDYIEEGDFALCGFKITIQLENLTCEQEINKVRQSNVYYVDISECKAV